jgi:ADP-ribose pyrophosphatase YjhB (NUDIX family)
MNPERTAIINKLMHHPNLTFNKVWEKKGKSNNFAYHLKILEEDGYVEQHQGKYHLSHKGKKYATYVDGGTGTEAKFPLIGVIIVVFRKKDEILMMKRLKEPFYGYWGVIGGKLKFSQYILECAQQELLEESGLHADLTLKGLFSSKTMHNGSLSYNHEMFIIKGINPKGKLVTKTREGECAWKKISEISKMNIFPNIPNSIAIAQSKQFRWVEADRIQENDQFKEMIVQKDMLI